MATIQSSIALYDNFSPVLHNITDALNLTIASVEHMQQELGENFNTTSFQGAQESIRQAAAAMEAMNERIANTGNNISTNTIRQNQFNASLQSGNGMASNLLNTVKRMAGAYITMQGLGKVINASDNMASTNARLQIMNEMNGSLHTQQELQDAIFASAERSRGKYNEMASTVAKLGIQASKAFSGGANEIIAFTELMNKSFVTGGASATEQSAAMYQLTQAMSTGKLQGDEYRSIIENAPQLATAIEDYMVNVQHAEGSMKEWASEGLLTADVIKAALFSASDEINERFEQMPMTFGQIWNSITNRAQRAFQPLLQRLNDIANSERFDSMVDGAIGALTILATVATEVFDLFTTGAAFIHDNWSTIGPIFYGVAAAVGFYTLVTGIQTVATTIAAKAQSAWNMAMSACPAMKVAWGIIAVISAIYILTGIINEVCDVSISATGMIVGFAFYIVGAITNCGLVINNIAFGIWEVMKAVAENTKIAFMNSINSTKGIFYGLASTALTVIALIAQELNKLPFVEFDYSGLSAKATEYAQKSATAFLKVEGFKSVGDAWNKGAGTYGLDDFLNLDEEFDRGYDWAEKMKEKLGVGSEQEQQEIPDYSNYINNMEGIANNTGATAGNTADIKDSLEITTEELKYLRDIKEREVIDRTVLKSVTIDMSGMVNKVENKNDLDGISTYLAKSLKQQMEVSMEGV